MKTIGSINGLVDLDIGLIKFILGACPWMAEQWEPETIGYVFVLDDNDNREVCIVPQVEDSDYREAMTIDLETFDLWEVPATYDEATGYWNVVAILGEEYGCTLFLSSGFVASVPLLQERLSR